MFQCYCCLLVCSCRYPTCLAHPLSSSCEQDQIVHLHLTEVYLACFGSLPISLVDGIHLNRKAGGPKGSIEFGLAFSQSRDKASQLPPGLFNLCS
ncbi:hypothetical protein F4808DRAFT_180036 [Astrocystis sublimbata]|nr:hypothetical protein F4808DRAFT_180036 [Astrocystis sublimbata]